MLIKKGSLLIAEPTGLSDLNFNRSVILLVEHNKSGSVGFILNKKLNYSTISEWTGLDKETVRRTCKKAQTQNWIKINAESGITINIEGGAGEPFVALHEQVRPLVERFVKKSADLI